mmetsp:Transcript_12591/g.19610  ORF Transcript_12591/g.19610 Transcript_12591/m.19610 type:complete len:99 (+) Transcript_12591:171-467(+)
MLKDHINEAEDFYWRIQLKYHYVPHGKPEDMRKEYERFKSEQSKRGAPRVVGLPDVWSIKKASEGTWITQDILNEGFNELSISCINSRIPYGYEYVGN